MKTQSAKAKGRKLQNWVRDKLIELLSVHEEDVESRSMGASGVDFVLLHGFCDHSYTRLLFSWVHGVPGDPKSDTPNRLLLLGNT